MKKITLTLLFIFCSFFGYSQAISVSTTTYTVPQLVTDVLFGSGIGGGACAGTISNITWSTGTNFGGPNGIGSFTNTNPNFPLQSGVVLVSGSVATTPGPNNSVQSNGNWPGDAQLFNYIDNLGIDPGLASYNNASILEFDFVPLTNTMSFDFLFASEEYGVFQCSYSDAFAFFLTNTTAGTPTTNLALIPATTTPVSVITIRDNAYNPGCPSVNPLFFDNYYLLPEGLNPATAPINFNGNTVKMTASSNVVPNNTYHIKLVVADRNDDALDSAVFLGGGSFNIGQANITGASGTGFEALTDFTIANGAALCNQSCREVRAGTAPIPGVTYQWTLGGFPIPAATNFNYNICAPGTYGIEITFPTGCQQIDTMEVEFLPAMPLDNPVDLFSGSTLFNLTLNTPIILDGQSPTDYIISYHLTLQDAIDVANAIPNPATYTGYNGQEIFVSIQDDASGTDCRETRSFFLWIQEPGAVTPPDLVVCDDITNDGIELFDLTQQTPIILGTNSPADYIVTYHTSQFDADNDLSPIVGNTNAYPNTSNPQTIYVRMEEVANSTAFDTVFFQLIVNQQPIAGTDGASVVCETSGASIDLFGLITGEQVGGVWVRNTGTGGTFNAAGGTFTPAVGATSSTFTYTVTGVAPCTTDSSDVSITINPQPDAGTSGGTTICETDGSLIDLFGLITGEQGGGVWTRTSGLGGTFNALAGTFTSAVGATTSTFEYTLLGLAPCTNSVSVATITINAQPTAGTSGSTTVCETNTASIDLFGLIAGEQGGGVWVRNTGTGGTFNAAGGTFTPAVGATTSTFTYTITPGAPCAVSSSVATININPQPVAGTDGSVAVCENNGATIDLFSLITGEQGGGVWVRNSGTGGTFNALAGTFIPAVGATTSIFEYQLTGTAPCVNDSSLATVTISAQPTAGTDGGTTICADNTTLILLSSLITGEQGGGVWVRNTGTGGTFNAAAGTFLPSAGVSTSTFTYTLAGTAPCLDDSSVATVTVNPLPTATIVASTPSVCLNFTSPTVTLTGLNGTAPYTFNYTENGNPLVSPLSSNTYVINVPTTAVGPIDYELVSVTDANGCTQNINQTVTVTVLVAPVINTPATYAICDDESNDGIACFDLAGVVAPQVTTDATLIVTFHETPTDAQTGSYPQASPYCNINNLNNQVIYIRVFDPNAPQCYATTSVQLIVNDKPTATDPDDLHECDNGDAQVGFTVFNLTDRASQILGTINPATHTLSYYESLPDANQPVNAIGTPTLYTNTVANTQTIWVRVEANATGCYDIVELQLVVDPLPLINQPACAAYTLCETTAPVGYEVFDLQSREACILQGQLGMGVTFYRNLTDANNNNNPITNLMYQNQVQYVQTLGIRITNVATGCYVVSTMDIRVDPLPVPVAPLTPYAVCDTDQNGLHEFDLNTLSASILGANPTGNTISYHETQIDANLDQYPISLTQPYHNTVAYVQTIWVRVENPSTGCYGVIPIQLRVNESPRMPNLSDLTYCDEDTNNQNGSTTVNLAQQTPVILAAQTVLPTGNYTVTYYTSLIDAQGQNNPIINTTTYTATNNQTIWVVVEHNITGCLIIGEFDIIINTPLALTPPPALSVCDDDSLPNNTFTTFDLTVRTIDITGNLPGYTITFYPSWPITAGSVAIGNPTAYMNTQAAVQTLGVMVTSPEGCRSYTTMDIRVLPVPTPNRTNIPVLAPQCEDAVGSGQQFFDLTVNEAYILNGDTNVTPHYYHSLADAQAVPPVNEIMNPSLAYVGDAALATQVPRPVNQIQYVYIAVTSNIFTEYTGQNCAVIVEQPLIINPLPIANAIGEQQICEEDAGGNDGIEVFDLTSYNTLILAGNDTVPTSTYTVSFFTDAGLTNQIANPSAYTNASNPQTIWVSVTTTTSYTDPVTGTVHTTSCTSNSDFDIRVNPKPTIAQPASPLATCDNDSANDGYDDTYSLASLEAEILNGQNPADFTVTFYESEYNPDATPPLNPAPLNPATHLVYTHTYWAAVTNNLTGCFKTVSFNIVVEQLPEPVITNDPALNTICVDFTTGVVVRDLTLESDNLTAYLNDPATPAPTYTYQWFEDGVALAGETNDTLVIDFSLNDNISSIFTLVMTSQSVLGCSDVSQDYLVVQSGQAVPLAGTVGYTVTNAFTDNQIITVTVEGYGTYLYSLDDGPRQVSPVFEGVGLGTHIITVWDTEGGLDNSCDPLIIEEVQTIDYPLYFTPNGDGIHDTWNIVGLSGQPAARIYIFDRQGKLIKQISSQSEGWNGTYNGQQMPATDYWFTVDYTEQNAEKQFRAHFSLKR